MRIIRPIASVLLLLAANLPVGRAASPLTWPDCVQQARENHPGLLAAQQSVEAAQAGIRAARAGHLPQLSASGRASYADDSKTGGGEESYQGALDVSQSLYDGGSTRAAVRSAEAEWAVALAEARQTGADILYDVRIAYADLLYAQFQIGLLEQIRLRRADNVEMVELRYLGGQENQGSLALNQASLREAEMDLAQARRALQTAQSVLARAMGLAGAHPELVVSGEFADVQEPGAEEVESLIQATPAYAKAKAALERAEAGVQSARSGYRPTASVYGAAARYGAAIDMEEDSLSAGVRLTLPLWEGGRIGAEVRQAAARKAVVQADLTDVANTQHTSLDKALQAYREAGENVTVQQQFASAQELRAAIAREQYANGLLKFDNWDIIENDLISRQKSLLETRRQALLAEAAWWRVTGLGVDETSGERP